MALGDGLKDGRESTKGQVHRCRARDLNAPIASRIAETAHQPSLKMRERASLWQRQPQRLQHGQGARGRGRHGGRRLTPTAGVFGQTNAEGLLDMPVNVEVALLSTACTWGALLAWCLDRSQRTQHGKLLAQTRLNLRLRRAELERQTRKILNHTASVMANAEQACDMAVKLLDAQERAPSDFERRAHTDQVRALLRRVQAEARGGYRMSTSIMVSRSIKHGHFFP